MKTKRKGFFYTFLFFCCLISFHLKSRLLNFIKANISIMLDYCTNLVHLIYTFPTKTRPSKNLFGTDDTHIVSPLSLYRLDAHTHRFDE